MITKGIWESFLYERNYFRRNYINSMEELNELTFLLIFTTLLTPISFILDIIFLPFEILYIIARKIVLGGEQQ